MPYKSRKTPSSIKILHLRPNDDRFGVNTPHNTDSTKSTIESRVRANNFQNISRQYLANQIIWFIFALAKELLTQHKLLERWVSG